jgi:hypothetical protein
MKAQRRHELQQSDLAKVIKQAPGFWQQSGGRWLLGAVAVLVIVILIRYRISSNRDAAVAARDSLAIARTLIEELGSQRMVMMTLTSPPNEAAMRRRQMFAEATSAIADVTTKSDDRTLAAEALVARGDLCWATATLPEIPGASTQQSTLQVRDPRELMTNAAEAYTNVLNSYPDVTAAAVAAHFGLAAIAENEKKWDDAKRHYEAALAATKDLDPQHVLAQQRLTLLPKLGEPVILGKPATEPAPTTGLSTTNPFISPFVAAPMTATTRAAMPATRPTSSTTRP